MSGKKESVDKSTKPMPSILVSRGVSRIDRLWILTLMAGVALAVFYIYCHDESNLSGEWVLDDKVSILGNPVVTGELPWTEIWLRDFWGKDSLIQARSHKSWRPLCTASYRLNFLWAGGVGQTYWWHLVDRSLYAIVAALVVPVTAYTYLHQTSLAATPTETLPNTFIDYFFTKPWFYATMTMASLLYASHPIHVESVANSTGRAEVLCALFYFLGFLFYARFGASVPLLQHHDPIHYGSKSVGFLGIVGMIICTLASTLSKEHGITLPFICIAWDAFVGTDTSFTEIRNILWRTGKESTITNRSSRRKTQCIYFISRSLLSLVFMFYIAVWRISKNGTYSSDFACEQNQGACLENPILKFFHFSFLWCFNFWLLINPSNLSADWTADAVPMLDDPLTDSRMLANLCLWIVLVFVLYHTLMAATESTEITSNHLLCKWRRTMIISFLWMLVPFLMSSNLFVYIGLTIADRTLFLPSFGFSLLLMQGLSVLCCTLIHSASGIVTSTMSNFSLTLMKNISVILLAFYLAKQQSYTKFWSKTVWLWCESNRVAPGSIMAERECGLSLVNAGYATMAAIKLQSSLSREMNSRYGGKTTRDFSMNSRRSDSERKQQNWTRTKSLMQSRFIATHSLAHSGRCKEALPLINEGLEIIDDIMLSLEKELTIQGGDNDFRKTRFYTFQEIHVGISTEKAALLVTKSKCAPDLSSMEKISFQALEARGDNENVIDHMRKVSDLVVRAKTAKRDPKDIALLWIRTETGYELSFSYPF